MESIPWYRITLLGRIHGWRLAQPQRERRGCGAGVAQATDRVCCVDRSVDRSGAMSDRSVDRAQVIARWTARRSERTGSLPQCNREKGDLDPDRDLFKPAQPLVLFCCLTDSLVENAGLRY